MLSSSLRVMRIQNLSLLRRPNIINRNNNLLLLKQKNIIINNNNKRFLSTNNIDLSGYNSKVCTVLGAQWGDEGKGKLVDILAKHYNMIGRFNGGANAGHTLVVDNKKYAFHLLPCGLLYDDKVNIIGNGVVVHVPTMFSELDSLVDSGISYENKLYISDRAHLLFDFHQTIDALQEQQRNSSSDQSIGTTKKGIGPAYSSKMTRNGVRVGEMADWKLFEEKYYTLLKSLQKQYNFEHDSKTELDILKSKWEVMKNMVTDTSYLVNAKLNEGQTLLAEGANAALLDIDHGTYPYVTSSTTVAGGICSGLGIAPSKIENTIGVVKAYTTRVGLGPFPTEQDNDIGKELQKTGFEFGTTTGRSRRCGWLDLPIVHYSAQLNGYQSLNITKLDVLSNLETLKIGTQYKIGNEILPLGLIPSLLNDLAQVEVIYEEMPGWQCDISQCRNVNELPEAAQNYVKRVEELMGIPVSWIGVGASREAMINTVATD